MDLSSWIDARGGIVHRGDALDAGFSAFRVRDEVRCGRIARVRRAWLRTPVAPPLLVAAAQSTARLACVSAARQRGWWMPEHVGDEVHLHVKPRGERPDVAGLRVHWTSPIVPVGDRALLESIEDTLDHVAACLAAEDARVVWESAIRVERLTREALRRVRWRHPAARACAAAVSTDSDSGIETIFITRVGRWGLPLRQQVRIAGHPVDVLIGDRLVVQLDGFAHHSTSADRTRDVAHDRELVARGYTVLRFTYAEVVHRWPAVERAIARAVAQGLHLAA